MTEISTFERRITDLFVRLFYSDVKDASSLLPIDDIVRRINSAITKYEEYYPELKDKILVGAANPIVLRIMNSVVDKDKTADQEILKGVDERHTLLLYDGTGLTQLNRVVLVDLYDIESVGQLARVIFTVSARVAQHTQEKLGRIDSRQAALNPIEYFLEVDRRILNQPSAEYVDPLELTVLGEYSRLGRLFKEPVKETNDGE